MNAWTWLMVHIGDAIPALYDWGWVPSGKIGDGALWFGDTAAQRAMNTLSPYMPDGTFKARVRQQLDAGANWTCPFTCNAADGEAAAGTPGYTIYADNIIAGQVDKRKVKQMQERIRYMRKKGLRVSLCLHADDDNKGFNSPRHDQAKHHADIVKHFDDYVCGYWLCLEPGDSSGWGASLVAEYVADLKQRTRKPVGMHDYPGRTDYVVPGLDVWFHQYWHPGSVMNHSAGEMEHNTREIKARIGTVKMHACEFGSWTPARAAHIKALRQAAKRGGAFGTGS